MAWYKQKRAYVCLRRISGTVLTQVGWHPSERNGKETSYSILDNRSGDCHPESWIQMAHHRRLIIQTPTKPRTGRSTLCEAQDTARCMAHLGSLAPGICPQSAPISLTPCPVLESSLLGSCLQRLQSLLPEGEFTFAQGRPHGFQTALFIWRIVSYSFWDSCLWSCGAACHPELMFKKAFLPLGWSPEFLTVVLYLKMKSDIIGHYQWIFKTTI